MFILKTHSTAPYNPAEFALVTLTVPLANRIIKRMDTAHDLKRANDDFFQVEYWAWGEVQWIEENECLETIESIMVAGIDFAVTEVEVDCRTMRVEPDSVIWMACIKQSGKFVETGELSRLDIEEWLDEHE